MKNNYVTPMIEVVEIEIEDAILQTSGEFGSTSYLESFASGNSLGEEF